VERPTNGRRVQSDRVFGRWDQVVFVLLSAANLATGLYFVVYWTALRGWKVNPIGFALVAAWVAFIWGNHLVRWGVLVLMTRPRSMPIETTRRVAVVTTFVPGSEPREMIERTLRAAVAITHPHDTWLLDEADDPRVRALCTTLGVRHFTRHGKVEYNTAEGSFKARTKYANYNAWFDAVGFSQYDVVTSLDPDHVPIPTFLDRVLGYLEDPRVGYVQAAQIYGNQKDGLIARGAAEETYAYYSSVQMAAHTIGFPIVVGCHCTHRIEALKQIGGFPPHDAEDLLLTQYYRAARWEGVYVPEVLARGLAPSDWVSYLVQQRRWARSVLDIKLRGRGQLTRMPLAARLAGFVHGFNYLSASFSVAAAVLFAAYLLAFGQPSPVFATESLTALAPWFVVFSLCELYRQRFYLQPAVERGIHWRILVLRLAKWPYMLLALADVLLDRQPAYTITPKRPLGAIPFRAFIPHALSSGLLVAAALFGLERGISLAGTLYLLPGLPIAGAAFAIVLGMPSKSSPGATSNTSEVSGDSTLGPGE
jgi:cellulose synthase/poly-beta-1,6-N-acetylglucosamine synthase-like glycosyltransferase